MRCDKMKQMLLAICDEVILNEKLLCELDSGIGDGDHGTTVARGFKEVRKQLNEEEYTCPGDMMEQVGNVLARAMGGAIGPILGSFFQAGAEKNEKIDDWGLEQFSVLFTEGLTAIKLIGEAKEGDHTLVDALSPAASALEKAMVEKDTLKAAFDKAYAAALSGRDLTKTMQARKGRARFLGEKSIGYVDAGATTMTLIIGTMCKYM